MGLSFPNSAAIVVPKVGRSEVRNVMDVSVEGLRVVVTAAGSGIGRAIAETFLQNGARVHICDVDEDSLAEVRSTLPQIGATRADVGDAAQVDRLFDEALEGLGGVDALINNAGIAGPTAMAEEVAPDEWDRTLAVNLSGQFYAIRRAVPVMKQAGSGSIVNISSTSGRTGLPLRLPYAVSKHAVMGLTETLAREVGPSGIRVNTILPGFMNNERGRRIIRTKAEALGVTTDAYKAETLQFISLRTMIEPLEIAQMALYLCSAPGRHISGQHIGVCGNMEYER